MEKIIPEHTIFIMGNMRTGGTMMDKRGISSKTVKNLQDMEKIAREHIIL